MHENSGAHPDILFDGALDNLGALSYKFQIPVYFFEVYTHCEAPKLISNKFVIHPFCDFPKLKLTHREEFPSLGGHQKPLPAGWTSRISRWVDFIIGCIRMIISVFHKNPFFPKNKGIPSRVPLGHI